MAFDPARQLAEERERVLTQLAQLRADFAGIVEAVKASNGDDEHDPEGTTIAFERSQVQAHIEQAQEHLTAVDKALVRLEEGSYGVCERCGGPIPEGRLEARPTASTCVACARH
ncbi:MAG TPA: TraR/DksA C4-type zinc finger protein [Marmoricola sp.]|jgi:RNA polymerase-binding transcription factor DksA|nr:TraR/DksA C4-type zinc finger protein [Marmoricola sp.]